MKQFAPLVALIITSLSAWGQYTWLNKNPFSGGARYDASCFTVNGKGYMVGGHLSTTSLSSTNQVWQYDPTSDSWTRKSDFPYPCYVSQCAVVNNIVYKIGGSDSTGYYYDNVYAYDPTTDTWTVKAPFPENGIGGNFQFVLNGKIYVGAGPRNNSIHGSVSAYCYDPVADTWTPIANYPGTPSITVVGFAIDSFGYAGLGANGNGSFYNDFFRYDAVKDTWTRAASFPGKGRFTDFGHFTLNGKGYIGFGGTDISSTEIFYCLGDLYEYDPTADNWTPVPGNPGPPRFNPAVFSFSNAAYIVGGYGSDGPVMYNDVSEFTPCGNEVDTITLTVSDTNRVNVSDTLIVTVNDTTHFFINSIDTLIIKANLTGVSSLDNSITVKVFPNPAKNHLQVVIDNDYASMKGYVLKITNILSQNVFVSPVNKQQFDIDIGSWGGPGTYALYIVDPQMNVVATKMIIIQ